MATKPTPTCFKNTLRSISFCKRFGDFKQKLGNLSRFIDIAQLHESIALQVQLLQIHAAFKGEPRSD